MNRQGWFYQKIDLKGLGERIKELRGNESQGSFAEKFGVSQADISRLERGTIINPSPELLFNICISSHVDLQWLLTGEEPPRAEEKAPELESAEREYAEKLAAITRSSPETAAYIKGMIDIKYQEIKPEEDRAKKGA